MSIVVVGSIAFDSVKTPFGSREHALGGAANYFSLASRFFSNIQMVGVVGEDFPESHLDFLKEKGVDTSGVERKYGKTFHWKARYGFDLNEAQTLQTDINVFGDFSPKLPEKYRSSKTVFLANIDPDLQLEVLEQVEKPDLVALDTMNFWIEGKNAQLKKAIRRVDILFLNDSEARQLAEERNIIKAARSLQKLGPKTIVVKRGEYGSLLLHEENVFFSPAYPLEDLFDPTGAGDTFAGGFMGWIDRSHEVTFETLKEAMTLGTVMASFVIEKFSFDRMKNLSAEEIKERYQHLRRISLGPQTISFS